MRQLAGSLRRKAGEFHDAIKIGRTHLQDAVPMRMGQEFGGYARQVEAAAERVERRCPASIELALGGTAVGTGLNAPPASRRETIAEIARRTGLPFRRSSTIISRRRARATRALLPERRAAGSTPWR